MGMFVHGNPDAVEILVESYDYECKSIIFNYVNGSVCFDLVNFVIPRFSSSLPRQDTYYLRFTPEKKSSKHFLSSFNMYLVRCFS